MKYGNVFPAGSIGAELGVWQGDSALKFLNPNTYPI